MIVNEVPALTIGNETTNFIKTIVLKRTIFKKRTFKKTIVSFSIFRRRFPNEIIVFQKNENVNIPITWVISQKSVIIGIYPIALSW